MSTIEGDGGDGAEVEKAARLVDVARLAKVSRATAARALGGYGPVTEATREKVLAAATALNYQVNELARSMRSGRTLTIGVVVADIANSFFNGVIRAIIETSAAAGYQILVLNTDDDIERERDAIRVLLEKRVDGLIVVPSSPSDIEHLTGRREPMVPIVLLDRHIDTPGHDSVTTDDFEGSRAAVSLLIRRGHSRIGMLVATASTGGHGSDRPANLVTTVRDRVDGGLAALKEHGIEPRTAWIFYSRMEPGNAKSAAIKILTASPPRPTAVLTTNEEMTLALIDACHQLELSVGEDVSIIGFDDAPWARVFQPPLSVVKRPIYELGETAVKILLAKIAGDQSARSVRLPTTIVDRHSICSLSDRIGRA